MLEDAQRQAGLRSSPAFSSTPKATSCEEGAGPGGEANGAKESASEGPDDIAPLPLDDTAPWDTSADISSAYSHHTSETTEEPLVLECPARLGPAPAPPLATISPCSDIFGESPGKFKPESDGHPLSNASPKTPKHGKGHRRAALATITNLAHVIGLCAPPNTLFPLKDSSVTGAPMIQRARSQSLRRKPAFEDLHSPSPKRKYSQASLKDQRASPTKRPVSIVWFSDKNGIPYKSVSPLRIVKRNRQPHSSPDPQPKPIPALISGEHLQDMVSAVRNLRETDDDDEGAAARELINRASIWTCKTAVTVDSRREDDLDHEEDTDEEVEYGDQATYRSTCSPPPPYAFSNTQAGPFSAPKETLPVVTLLSSRNVEVESPCRPSTSDSTELSYLRDGSPLSSAESSFDDILTSFEGLISTMGPRYQSPIPKMFAATENKAEAGPKKAALNDSRPKGTEYNPYDGIANDDEAEGCGVPHWSEVLLLDGYTI